VRHRGTLYGRVPDAGTSSAWPASRRTALPDWPMIGLRLDPRFYSGPPVPNMTSDPVTARTLTAVTPTIERGYRHAEQLRNLEQRHEPFAALEPAGLAFWRTSYFGSRGSLTAGREWHDPSLLLRSNEPALPIGKRCPESVDVLRCDGRLQLSEN
jgi:hypothetical protein